MRSIQGPILLTIDTKCLPSCVNFGSRRKAVDILFHESAVVFNGAVADRNIIEDGGLESEYSCFREPAEFALTGICAQSNTVTGTGSK
jgi:hypothetical protein